MSNLIKKLFGTLLQKPWEKDQMVLDTSHPGKTFDISLQKSAVIIIFGRSLFLLWTNLDKETLQLLHF